MDEQRVREIVQEELAALKLAQPKEIQIKTVIDSSLSAEEIANILIPKIKRKLSQ